MALVNWNELGPETEAYDGNTSWFFLHGYNPAGGWVRFLRNERIMNDPADPACILKHESVYVSDMNNNPKPTIWGAGLMPGAERGIFDHIPHLLYFAKDVSLRLRAANRAFAEHCGMRGEEDVVGRTDHDLFPVEMAEKYRQDDLTVLRDGQPMCGIVELFPDRTGRPEWFITDKIPLFDHAGQVAGLCGVVRGYERARLELQPYLDLRGVTEYLKTHFTEAISIKDLAGSVNLSPRHLERKFRKLFQISPRGYVTKLRVLKGCELLAGSALTVSEIAQATGFYDHSAFSRQFQRQIGMSPTAYRRQHR